MNISQDGGVLSVSIIKEEMANNDAEDVPTELITMQSSNNIWTIEVLNATTGIRQDDNIYRRMPVQYLCMADGYLSCSSF